MEKYLSKNGLCCGFIGLFALLLWGQTVRFGFVWDDELYIAQNKSIRSLANIPQIFTRKEAQSAETPSVSYRPLRNTVYALLHALGGRELPQPWIFHLANVLWHCAASMLLFLVALLLWQRLTGGVSIAARLASLLIALGFAAHPVNSEAVCWAKCMDDLMAGVFVLAAAGSLLKWNEGGRGYGAAVVWFSLAVFSKESALPFALAVPFVLHGFHKLPWRRSTKLAIPFFLVAFFYAAFQRWVMGHLSQCPPLSGGYGQTLIDMFPVASEYLRLLWGIPPFCADYNFMVGAPPHPLLSGSVLGGMFLVLLVAALTAWMWRRLDWRMSAFGFLWIALFLLPVSNLVPMMQYMAERFLYLPLMGFLLAVGGLLLNFSRLRLAAAVAASALVVIWTGTSLSRMGIWRDNLTLFVRTEMEHPGIKRVEKNAVASVFSLPQITVWRTVKTLSPAQAEAIITTLEEARRIYPDNDMLTMQLGMTEARIGRWREAVWYLELAARQNPDSAERWYDLASVYRLAGQPAKAQEANARALRLDPKYKEALQLQTKLENEAKPGNAPEAPAPK
jgi:protein O-mannosyl-transferase